MADYDKERIIRYVDDELSAEERLLFEADLRTDPSLQAEVALYGELRSALRQRLPEDAGVAALRDTLQNLNAKYFAGAAITRAMDPATPASHPSDPDKGAKTIPMKTIPMKKWLIATAAAAAVILAIVWAWPPGTKNYLDKLGETEMIGTAERGDNADSLLQQAAGYFNKQDFDKALPVLDKAVAADSNDQLALFYRGVSEWHTGSVVAARKDLQKVYAGGSLLQYEAAFYMALSHAGQNDKAAAREWLKKIPEDAPVAEKAAALSKKLE